MRSFTVISVMVLACIAAGCGDSRQASEFRELAQRLALAAVQQDSAQIQHDVADTRVLRDLALVERESPGLLARAARGLEVDHVGEVWADSAYVYFRTAESPRDQGLDLGFVRRGDSWAVYYIGITGSDLRGTRTGVR